MSMLLCHASTQEVALSSLLMLHLYWPELPEAWSTEVGKVVQLTLEVVVRISKYSISMHTHGLWPSKCYVMQWGINFSEKKRYKLLALQGVWGYQISRKKALRNS